jgi:hypothetical protein
MAKNNFKDSIHKEKTSVYGSVDGIPQHMESETTGLTKLEYFALKIYCARLSRGEGDINGSINSAKELLIRIGESYNG